MNVGILLTALCFGGLATGEPQQPPADPRAPASAIVDPPPPSEKDPLDTWPALLGSGLLTLQDTTTLPKGRFNLSVTIDNRDRDPLGLDLFDGSIAMSVGATSWLELYGHHVFSRAVAVPDTPVLPPPPLDAILPPGTALPPRPFYSVYSPVPYVDDSGPIRFGSDIPGEVVLGVKARAPFAQRGWRPLVAGSLEVQLPLKTELKYLQAGSGTGGVDVRMSGIGEWRHAPWSFVATSGFTIVGEPAYPDRRIEWRNGIPFATDEPLILPYRLDMGLGARRMITESLAAVAEATTVVETGHRTRSLDRTHPFDILGGLQYRWRAVRVTAALRHHGNAFRGGTLRPSPLAGVVDVTHVSIEDLTGYLGRMGALDDAAPLLRPGTNRLLFPTANMPPLPAGARVIPDSYRIRSEHQWGFMLVCGMRF
jgi:hypothetical protein